MGQCCLALVLLLLVTAISGAKEGVGLLAKGSTRLPVLVKARWCISPVGVAW